MRCEMIDTHVDLGHDLVERGLRRQRIADQRHVDALRQQSLGHDREILLGAHLPVAAVNEQHQRSAVRDLQDVDTVAFARSVTEVEMIRVARAQRGRAAIPVGDNIRAARNCCDIVQPKVEIFPRERPPVHRIERNRHG